MVARTLWLWLSVGWLLTWLTEAVVNPGATTICSLGPCTCNRGKLVCDCSSAILQEVTLRAEFFDSFSFSSISISNCLHVHVGSQALMSLAALQQVSIANIQRFTLEEKAFDWKTDSPQSNGLLVNITNCGIPDIPSYCFQGSLRDILMHSVRISRIQAFAFSSLKRAERIEFSKVNFTNVETQSFKNFPVQFLTFSECHITVCPRRTIMDVEVHQEARVYKVKADRFSTGAFTIKEARNFKITQSKIGYLEEKAFDVLAKGDVSIHDNVFSFVERRAFVGFSVDKRYIQEAGKQDFIFENNTLVNFANECLTVNTSGFSPRLDWIVINQTCSCAMATSWTTDLVFFASDSSSKTAPQVDSITYCLNPKQVNIKDFLRFSCNVIHSSLLLKVLVIIGILVAVLAAVGFVVYCTLKKRGKRYIGVPTSLSALKPANNNKANMLVVPDGKTYRETELHVIVEHAEPIINTEYVKERAHRNGKD